MPVAEGRRRVGAPPQLASRDDVEHREARDRPRMIERHPVGHSGAAVVPGDGEHVVSERDHRRDQVLGQRSLGVRRVVSGHRRPERAAVPGQIRRDHGEPVRQGGRDGVPHQVCLRRAVEQQQRRPVTADSDEDLAARRGNPQHVEAGEERIRHRATPCSLVMITICMAPTIAHARARRVRRNAQPSP